jgi:hypothetical protein
VRRWPVCRERRRRGYSKALEEDREFRYALMGLLGYRELLDRVSELEERQRKLEERQQRLEEEMRETRRILAVIAHRFGILSEEGLRKALKYVVEEGLGADVAEAYRIGVLTSASQGSSPGSWS